MSSRTNEQCLHRAHHLGWSHHGRLGPGFRIDSQVIVLGPYQRMTMSETCLYTVKDGQIIESRFFYDCNG